MAKSPTVQTLRRVRALATTIGIVGCLLVPVRAAAGPITIYVSMVGSNIIEQFTAGGLGSTFASALHGPTGLAFDSVGNLYVANSDTNTNTITRFTPGGVASVFASTGLNNPLGLAFDSAGNLYAANFLGNTIEKFTPGGVGSVFASTGLDGPAGLAFDSAGNLYVANFDHGTPTIEKFTPSGIGSVFASTGLCAPRGLAFDAAGNLYVGNACGSALNIERFTPAGDGSVFASMIPVGPPDDFFAPEPMGLAFDSAGNLYVAGYNHGAVEKFTPDGVGSIFASTGDGNIPTFIAIQGTAVPEPASLLLLGTGLAALATRRRSKTRS